MNVTIFPTGTGSAKSAVDYLLSEIDHEKKTRSVMPEILFGDPTTFIEIADGTNRKHKYTSGVISFRDHESITPEQINTLIETFRSTFMPGLKVDENFADFWVAHRDKGNLELHFLVANSELKTSAQLNIHPPGEKNIQFFNAFSSVMNDTFGFAQIVPDPLKISLNAFETKAPDGKHDKKAKNDFAKVLHSEIVGGFITNRNQLIGYMKKNGMDIPKIGDDFITVRLPGAKKNTRLKGPLFRKDSDYAALVNEHHASKIPKFLTSAEAQSQREKLTNSIQARAAFNQRRYLTPKPGAKRSRAIKNGPVSAVPKSGVKDRKSDRPTTKQPDIAATLQKQLKTLKEDAAKPSTAIPKGALSGMPNKQPQAKQADPHTQVMGESAVGGLQTQIGSLSMQYHCLMLALVSATGRRAAQIKSQIIMLEQKLIALNLELEKKKAQLADDKQLKIR